MTLSSCLRNESIYKTDLCILVYHSKSERSPYQILIMRIGNGKTVHNENMFGRVVLHVDVRQYPVELCGLWLLARFKEINEVNDYVQPK